MLEDILNPDRSALEITPELRAAALAQAAEMKENDISRRWFTAATRSVIYNAENAPYKDLVHTYIGEVIDSWSDFPQELMAARETYLYGMKKIYEGKVMTHEDYATWLTAQIVIKSIESKVPALFGRTPLEVTDGVPLTPGLEGSTQAQLNGVMVGFAAPSTSKPKMQGTLVGMPGMDDGEIIIS